VIVSSDEVAAGYAGLLLCHEWHWFATLTFSPSKTIRDRYTGEAKSVDRFHPLRGMHLEAADKAWRWWVFELNKRCYGKNWRRVPHGGVVWARGQEFHKSGRVHFHAVMAAPDDDLNAIASRYRFHELWFREFGRNQIERPRDQEEVGSYISKYVTKDGEVDFSANFGTVTPPRLFDGWEDRTAGVLEHEAPAPADDRSSTRAGKRGPPGGASLSLTLPVRLKKAQLVFTEESYFNLCEENQNACCDR
jgi:hypothetical protein